MSRAQRVFDKLVYGYIFFVLVTLSAITTFIVFDIVARIAP